MSQSTLGELTDTVTDVLSTAADQVGYASDAVLSLVDTARDKVRPASRRRFNPWFLVAAALATALAVGWFARRRRADNASSSASTSDLRDYRAAAGS